MLPSDASNLEPQTMGIVVTLLSIAMVVLLRWWGMIARLKAHDPLRQFGWPAADQAAKNAVELAALASAIESASRFNSADEI